MSVLSSSPSWRRLAAGTVAALAAGLLAALPATAPPAAAAESVTITPNPWYASEPFQGWGTSLAWFANVVGGYPDSLRQQLYDDLFTDKGLDMQVARYNVGGGNASDVADYLRPGGAVQGWWKADPDGSQGVYGGVSTTYDNRSAVLDAFDPSDDAQYDANADATQRWWVDRLAADRQIRHWEVFANSAPYFMTGSGYVSGRTDPSTTQVRTDAEDKFVAYITHVTDLLEQKYGISVDSLEPLNEPYDCSSCWATGLRDGKPVARQEGMTVGPQQQATIVKKLRAELDKSTTTTHAVVAAPDEVNASRLLVDWQGYDDAAKAALGQVNVHAYGTDDTVRVRDIAKSLDRPVMMSETEGSFGNGYDPADIANGLFIAKNMNDSVRQLEPESWVLWQPVEDQYNMAATGENLNWGSIYIDFDCRWYDQGGTQVFKSARRVSAAGGDPAGAPDCGITTGAKFDAQRNFMNFIRAGDRIIATDDTDTTAAVNTDARTVTLVYANSSTSERRISVDLSRFGAIAGDASVKTYTTTQSPSDAPGSRALVPSGSSPVDVSGRSAAVDVPARSITTIVVSGVSGVADAAAALADGHSYQIIGQGSGKAVTATSSGSTQIAVASDLSSPAASQSWTMHEVAAGTQAQTRRYVISSGDRVLVASGSGTSLASRSVDDARSDPAARWILNTTDGKTYSLVNERAVQALDVSGASSDDGATVGLWPSSGASNQAWTFRDLAVGATVTDPVSSTVSTGTSLSSVQASAPTTVGARAGDSSPAQTAVTWDWSGITDAAFASAGVVTVPGATVSNGASLSATLSVIVVDAPSTNINTLSTTAASATSTEKAQYSVDNTRNGVLDDKGWSNWHSGTQNASDTLTYAYPGAQRLDEAKLFFFKDGPYSSWPAAISAQYRADDGSWRDVDGFGSPQSVTSPSDGSAPVVTVPLGGVSATAVRFALTARPDTHLIVSEVQVFAPHRLAAAVADLAALRVAGASVAGFSPSTVDYTVSIPASDFSAGRFPRVTAIATDATASISRGDATASSPVTQVTVTAEDGTTVKTYRVRFVGA